MRIPSRLLASFAILLSSGLIAAQPNDLKPPPPKQTARQALIEILTGNGQAAMKHLTVEMQQLVAEQMGIKVPKSSDSPSDSAKPVSPAAPSADTNVHVVSDDKSQGTGGGMVGGFPFAGFGLSSGPGKKLETFDAGPILLTVIDDKQKEKIELRVEGDDMRGDVDNLLLSYHFFRDGEEKRIPFVENFTVSFKEQEKIWRVTEISGNIKISVGDPQFFKDLMALEGHREDGQGKEDAEDSKFPERKHEYPKFPVQELVGFLASAEGNYASQNPENGFTCNLADLVGDKGMGGILDPQIATGTYNGYRLSISGCDRRPADAFHLIAEPVGSGADSKAYCTDATRNVRSSDDGRGLTCLLAGKVAKAAETSDDDPD